MMQLSPKMEALWRAHRTNTWIRGRPYRHGYRVEGDYIKKKYGKDHLFFKSEEEALASITSKEAGHG